MAAKSEIQRRTSEGMAAKFLRDRRVIFSLALLLADAVLVSLIIAYVPCKTSLSLTFVSSLMLLI